MPNDKLRGVFSPITTPFLENEDVDYKGLEANVEFYAASGIHGYLALGSNGENKSLLMDEKFQTLDIVLKKKAPSQVVMAGCIAESLRETLYIAQKAEGMGCDFATLLSPNYFKKQMTDDVLFRYFTDIADQLSIPCLIYNAPGFSGGLTISPALMKRLAQHPNIVGMKDSSVGNIDSYLGAVPEDFAVLAGSVSNFLQGLQGGALGGVLSLVNAFPAYPLKLYDLFMSKQYEECFAFNRRILTLNALVSGKGGVSSVKAAMDLAGLTGGIPRRPLLPLSDDERAKLRETLASEGLLG